MKKVSLVILINILLFFSLQTTFSQSRKQTLEDLRKMPATQKAQIVTDSLKNILKLSNEQYNKMYTIALEGIKKAAPLVQNNNSRIIKGWQLRSILNSIEEKLKLILTTQQFTTYESAKEKTIAYYRKQARDDDF